MLVLIDLAARHFAAQDLGEDVAVVIRLRGIDRHCSQLRLTLCAASLPRKAMSDDTPESHIPYDEIVQEALRDVVGRVLGEVERSGVLPGGASFLHHLPARAIPGVAIPKHLSERFPDEMTIVIQHRFWDLKVEDDRFLGRPVVRRRAVDPDRAVRRGDRFRRPGGRFLAEVPGQWPRTSPRIMTPRPMTRRSTSRPTMGRTSSRSISRARSDALRPSELAGHCRSTSRVLDAQFREDQ